MLNRKHQPQIHEIACPQLISPEKIDKLGKIPFYLFKNEQLDLIHIFIKIEAGALNEPKKFVAPSCYCLIKESSSEYSAAEFDDFLAFYGTTWKTAAQTQFVSIEWVIPKRNLKEVLPKMWKTLCEPVFRTQDLERFQQSRIKDLEYNSAKFNYRATQLLFAEMFDKNMPIGTILTKEHIENVTIEDLQNYHNQTFTPELIKIYAAGNCDFTDLDFQFFTPTLKGAIENPCKLSPNFPSQIIETKENALQSSFILSKQNIGFNHKDRVNFDILSTLFGGFFGSRLMQNLREENGFTYSVFCNSFYFQDKSIFYIECDVVVDKTEVAINECFKEMLLLQNELIDEEELELVKSYLLGEALREIDGVRGYMKKFAFWNEFGKDETEMQSYIEAIKNITPITMQALAKQYLQPESFTKIVVGKLSPSIFEGVPEGRGS